MSQTSQGITEFSRIAGLPAATARKFRRLAWWVFYTQVLIIGTGGAVRLTGSGLGCDTWPKCAADSYVHNPAMGIHSYIEFGNRLLFFLLEIVAVLAVIVIWKYKNERKDLFWLSVIPALSVFIQAILGGITVLTGLNPYIVGLHYVASVLLVMLSALLVLRTYRGPVSWHKTAPIMLRQWGFLTALFTTVTVMIGILTTGSGPHAGDGGAARNNLDSEMLSHVHALAAYATLAAIIITFFIAKKHGFTRVQRFADASLLVIIFQIVIGVVQARHALPAVLVGIHMVLAALLAASIFLMFVEIYATLKKVRADQ